MMTVQFPPPRNEDDFDALVCMIAERKYGELATRYGRSGQSQYGVDITLTDRDQHLVAIQSKHTAKLTRPMMEVEIDKLYGRGDKNEPFPFPVDSYIFATSARDNTHHINTALALQAANPPLRVSVWAWGHLNGMLNTMPDIAANYCQAFLGYVPVEDIRTTHAKCLRQVFERPAILDTIVFEGNFTDQANALRDMAGFLRTGNFYDRRGILIQTVTPYTDDDNYGRGLIKLQKAVQALGRHIETNLSTLNSFALGPDGRVIDPRDPGPAKIYLDYEAKRLTVLRLVNGVLTERGLPVIEATI